MLGGVETSRRAKAPRRQTPHGSGRRSPSLTPLRGHQSPRDVALFLSKKGKHVRQEGGLLRAQRVPSASSRCNKLGSIILTLDKLRQITNNFSDDQLLGEGGFGKVYKGVLINGDIIAVKRFAASTVTGLQDVQYENEAQHLMRLKHRNIVQFVGYCSETEVKLVRHNGTFVRAETPQRLLCLEYMPNGSLRGHLSDETSGLEWNTRFKIIKGICNGPHYLHEEWQATPIIHMDLKPANILLDDNMVPKIADFGLSRLFREEQTRTCTRSCKGTPGYMAPEYINGGVITKKFDIFSLGVIIIEIITGHKDYPIDDTETSQQYIDHVLNNWRHRLKKAQGYTSQDIDYLQIKKCIQIALLCVKFDQVERPTINQIIEELERSDEAYQNQREVMSPDNLLGTDGGDLKQVIIACGKAAAENDTLATELNQREVMSPDNPLGTDGVDLKQVIIACGKAAAENDTLATELLISKLRQLVSPSGDPMQRLGAYMLEGIIARLSSSGSALYRGLKSREPIQSSLSSSEPTSYMHRLHEICPYLKFGYMSAHGAILEAMKGEYFVRIIDFQVGLGSQWVSLIQALAARPGGRPHLRITGIDDLNSAYAVGGTLDMVRRRLYSVAQSYDLPFEFDAVPASAHEIELQHLAVKPREAIAVNFAYMLRHVPDESVCSENHRDRLIRMIRSIKPRVVTLVEQESDTNTTPFFSRYMETLNYYAAVFETIDVALPRDDRMRISTEQHCVAKEIVNLIACEGAERVERHELFEKWKSRFAMAGFKPYLLSSVMNNTINTMLQSYHCCCKLEERDGVLYLGWKNRIMVVTSAWC